MIGVDGGGTNTTAWLAKATGSSDALGVGTAEGSNARRIGFENAFDNIESAVAKAFEAAGLKEQPIAAAVLALAGSDRNEDRAKFIAIAKERGFADRVSVVNDGMPLLALASPTGPAIAIVSGTGSIGISRDAEGQIRRSGGWGYLFGDEGSGFDLGAAALRAVAHAHDGRGESTALTDIVCDFFSVESPPDLITAVYDDPRHRENVAKLAGLVVTAADKGDATASAIVERAGMDIISMIRSLVRASSLEQQPFSLALSGGLFVHCPTWSEKISTAARTEFPSVECVKLVQDPARGAVQMAQQAFAAAEFED